MVHGRPAQPNELRTQPARSLLLRLFRDVTTLAVQEYQLARTELGAHQRVVTRLAWAAWFAVALGTLALGALTVAGVAALALTVGLPLAALIFGVVYAAIAVGVTAYVQREIARGTDLILPRTTAQFPKQKPSPKSLDEQESSLAWTRHLVEEDLAALERKSDLVQPLRDTAVGVGALGVAVANIVRENAAARH
jgi:putative superfamily III holin-X